MVDTIYNSLRKKRAKFARNLEYIREMCEEDEIEEACEKADAKCIKESADDIKDSIALLTEMPDDSEATETAEINRILESTHDLTFEEMIGAE